MGNRRRTYARIRAILVLLHGLLAACGAAAPPELQPVTKPERKALLVFAAASLKEAFSAIGVEFEAASGITARFNFAGSQQLARQIEAGAPADVFAAANPQEMGAAVAAGVVVPGTQQVFARNRLVVITPTENGARIEQLEDLAKPGMRIVLAAEQVPAGQYSQQILAAMSGDGVYGPDFGTRVNRNVVSKEENVRAVVTKVRLGEADAGIVYVTDADGTVADLVRTLAIPDRFNQIADFPIARTARPPAGADPAQLFVDYVLSDAGQRILREHGFIPVE